MEQQRFFPQSSLVHRATAICMTLITLRLMVMSYLFLRISSVSIRCIFIDSLVDALMAIGNIYIVQSMEIKPSKRFPYGLGKLGYLWNLLQGGILLVLSWTLLVDTLKVYTQPQKMLVYQNSSHLSLVAAIITLLVCVIEVYATAKSGNAVLKASMWNHVFDLLTYSAGYMSVVLLNRDFFGLDYILAIFIIAFMSFNGLNLCFRSCMCLCDLAVDNDSYSSAKNILEELIAKREGWSLGDIKLVYCGQWIRGEVSLIIRSNETIEDIEDYLRNIRTELYQLIPNTHFLFCIRE